MHIAYGLESRYARVGFGGNGGKIALVLALNSVRRGFRANGIGALMTVAPKTIPAAERDR